MIITPEFLVVFGLFTAAVCFLAVFRCRRELIPVHWLFMVAMAMGALGIGLFYNEIWQGAMGRSQLIIISRLLWAFILLMTSLMAIGILVHKK